MNKWFSTGFFSYGVHNLTPGESLAVVSGILMMIKFDLIYQVVRVAYTVFDISVVISVLISIIYFINDQFSTLKTEAQK